MIKVNDYVEVVDPVTRAAKVAAGEPTQGTVTAVRHYETFSHVEYKSVHRTASCSSEALQVKNIEKRWRK